MTLALAGAATADEQVPERRPEPVPLRLQAPLLRSVYLPAVAAATTAAPDEVQRLNACTVSVFRQSDAGGGGSGTHVTTVGDAVAGVAQVRVGLPQGRLPDLGFEYGLEVAALRWGRSPKFRDEGPVLDAEYGGARWLGVTEPEAGLLAPVAWLAGAWRAGAGVGLAVRGDVSFPGGSRRRGTGTREWGAAGTLALGVRLAPHCWFDANASVAWPGRPDGLAGGRVRLAPVWQGALALSWAPLPEWSFHLQAVLATNPFPATGIARLDEPPGEIAVAARFRPVADLALGVWFAEDLTRLAPDFTVALLLEYRLRGRSR